MKLKKIFDEVTFNIIQKNSNVEIIDKKRVIVEEMISIIDYCDTKVVIDIGKNILSISGENLNIYDYCDRTVIINGIIDSVSFE